ncbi:MAG: sigma-54 dependent transcriptional regulator, partial [Candidatus Margulisiibacteriota bacterium]
LCDGITLLKKIKSMDEGGSIDVIMLTALNEPKNAVEAIKAGAYDFICKPFEVEELKAVIARAVERKELLTENEALKSIVSEGFEDVIGRSPQMMSVMEQISSVAFSDASVVITGETGCGKELIAKTIHKKSKRAGKPFFAVNCAAIPENLFESEFFGYEKGAFTGAFERHAGKFEAADKSTLFLDEIACLPLPMQAKLLRVLQEGEVQRVGSAFQVPVDVRLISAANVDLRLAVKKGSFRPDLYFRLNVVPIHLCPLRERQDDILLFLDHFLARYNRKFRKKISGFSENALRKIKEYAWPGNIRELENAVERLVLFCRGSLIGETDILPDFFCPDDIMDLPLKEACEKFEKDYIEKALEEAGGNQTKAARTLKIDRTTLLSKVRRYL